MRRPSDLIGSAGTAKGYAADRALHVFIDLILRHSERGVVARRWDNAGANCIHP